MTKAKKALERSEQTSGVYQRGIGLLDSAESFVDKHLNKNKEKMSELYRSKGIKLDRTGNPITSKKISSMTDEEFNKALKAVKSQFNTNTKAVKDTKKSIDNIIEEMNKRRRPTESQHNNKIIAGLDNVFNRRKYNKNVDYNSRLDDVISRMKSGKEIKDIEKLKTKEGIIRKKVPTGIDFEQQLHAYNKEIASHNKAQKNINKSKSQLDNYVNENRLRKNKKDIDGVKRNIETYESAKDLAGTVKKVLGSQGDLANINTQKSRQNYRKELAKTIGAWGGIGAAGVAGTTAIANAAKPKKESRQSGPTFQPRYNYNDYVRKTADEIIESAIMEKMGEE